MLVNEYVIATELILSAFVKQICFESRDRDSIETNVWKLWRGKQDALRKTTRILRAGLDILREIYLSPFLCEYTFIHVRVTDLCQSVRDEKFRSDD